MTLEEAIDNFEREIVEFEGLKKIRAVTHEDYAEIERTRQLAEWLRDYKRLKEQEPCGDVISRQAVLDGIDAKAWEFCDYLISKGRNDEQEPVSHFADNLRELVSEELPSVKPQPKTGHWIWKTDDIYSCSECYEDIHVKEVMNVPQYEWCPMCGAKMIELQESEVNNG